MKIDWNTVVEFMLGSLFAGLVLIVISGLVGGWIASHGAALTGKKPDGTNFEG